ncbi:hypothetical protein MIR68_011723 [Amoeboaphelidium protococcarum]|nr:hypothetical protein MIR68_011723 [Amoeboaphelidium protococcarum]
MNSNSRSRFNNQEEDDNYLLGDFDSDGTDQDNKENQNVKDQFSMAMEIEPKCPLQSTAGENLLIESLKKQVEELQRQNIVLVKNVSQLYRTAQKELSYKNQVIKELRDQLATQQTSQPGRSSQSQQQYQNRKR